MNFLGPEDEYVYEEEKSNITGILKTIGPLMEKLIEDFMESEKLDKDKLDSVLFDYVPAVITIGIFSKPKHREVVIAIHGISDTMNDKRKKKISDEFKSSEKNVCLWIGKLILQYVIIDGEKIW